MAQTGPGSTKYRPSTWARVIEEEECHGDIFAVILQSRRILDWSSSLVCRRLCKPHDLPFLAADPSAFSLPRDPQIIAGTNNLKLHLSYILLPTTTMAINGIDSRDIEHMVISKPSSASIIRHPAYWFEDGSLIVQVQDVAYKLHKTLLTRHSPVLSTLSSSTDEGYSVSALRIPDELGVLSEEFERLLEHLYHDMYVRLIALSFPGTSGGVPCSPSFVKILRFRHASRTIRVYLASII